MTKGRNRRIVHIGKRKYSYEDMGKDIQSLRKRYSAYLGVRVLGRTPDERRIFCICLGNPRASKSVVVNASLHGREWLNTQLLMLGLEHCCREMDGGSCRGKSYRRLFKEVCVYLLPMMNPDGVSVSQYGAVAIRNLELRNMVERVAGKEARFWKANARGVDLNRNFDYGSGKNLVSKPSSMEYGGKKPLSEPETKMLVHLIDDVKPVGVVNYHETGPLIYYTCPSRLLDFIQKMTGYLPVQEMEGCPGSFGDWLTERGIAWCTVETCHWKAPVGHWQIYPCYLKQYSVLAVTAAAVYRNAAGKGD